MQVSGSPGIQAAAQLMQSANSISSMAAQQVTAVNNELQASKADALQNTASQMSQAVDRKGTLFDAMA
ncbi:MAG: hypothetical protein HUJ30_06625 [Gammaproteobacteria bacterium]|nr:hypothetical protein [Gammaproteobacteria bacterium]